MNKQIAIEKPAFREALQFWSKLGWISFGGTAAHIAIMHDYLVEQKKWISNGRFLHALSHCMILPGPEAQQLAIYIGWKLHGKKGGLAAGILFVLPSMLVLLALSVIYVRFGNLPWISAMFSGLKPAVIALIIIALLKVAAKALRRPVHWVVAAAAFIAMFFLNVSLPVIMLGAVILGLLLRSLAPSLLHTQHTAEIIQDESEYFINRYSTSLDPELSLKASCRLAAIVLLLWLMPITVFYLFGHDFAFWRGLTFFFTKTAFITIGGSYTVIPYVAQVTVAKLHWLTKPQMMDGFALAETTPGPLIIVVAFVGFMAGYNHFHQSLVMGSLALFATTFYTFLPCFLFVFGGAPIVERTQDNPAIEAILGLITAVVVGGILDLTLFLGKAVAFPSGRLTFKSLDLAATAWVIVSLLLMKKLKINVIYLIALSVAYGLARYLIGPHIS